MVLLEFYQNASYWNRFLLNAKRDAEELHVHERFLRVTSALNRMPHGAAVCGIIAGV
jgi:hypothetical protein